MATLDRLRQKVKTAVNDKGKTVTYTSVDRSYDPTTGESTETETEYSIKVTPPEGVKTMLIDGERIKVGDALISIPDYEIPFTPKVEDRVTIDEEDWTIKDIHDKVFSGELVALWTLRIRK